MQTIANIRFYSNNEDEYSQYTSQWMNFIEEDKTAARKAVNYLRAQGCRKIALLMPFQDVAENSLKSEFCQYSAKFGLDVVLLNINGGNNVELLKNFYLDDIIVVYTTNKLFKKGEIVKKVKQEDMVKVLKEEGIEIPQSYLNMYDLSRTEFPEFSNSSLSYDEPLNFNIETLGVFVALTSV